jgi:hypothetical protein
MWLTIGTVASLAGGAAIGLAIGDPLTGIASGLILGAAFGAMVWAYLDEGSYR